MRERRLKPLLLPLIAVDPAAPAAGAPITGKKTTEQQIRPTVRYLGFRTTDEGREYTMRATSAGEPASFVMLIRHQAFASGSLRFQDAPDLCSSKLTRLLAAVPGEPEPQQRLVFTLEELLEYRDSRRPPAPTRKRAPRNADGA